MTTILFSDYPRYGDPEIDTFNTESTFNTNRESTEWREESPIPSNNKKQTQVQDIAFIKNRYCIVIMSLLVYAVFALESERLISNAVFGPLIVWEILELIAFAKSIEDMAVVALIALMIGFEMNTAKFISKVCVIFNKIVGDFGIFIFVFSFCHFINQTFFNTATDASN